MAFNRKIFVVGASTDYANWMEGSSLANNIADADIVVFTGGCDVDPKLYGDARHPRTYFVPERDLTEQAIFRRAIELKKKMVGICRGAQFLCVMNGGKLVQHQANTDHWHTMFTDAMAKKVELLTSSEHHQAAHPWNLPDTEFKVLGWTVGQSPFHHNGNQEEIVIDKVRDNIEVEVCYYPKTTCLGIQGHPEWMFPKRFNDDKMKESVRWHQDLLDRLMWGSIA